MSARRLSSGFTLTELLVTVTVVGILATLAMPSFRSIIQSQQVKTASFELYASLSLARSEAIKRNDTVTVAPSASGWQAGWTLTTGSGTAIKTHGALKGVVVSGGPTNVIYSYTGRINAGTAPTFQIDNSGTATGNVRCIKMDLSGMPRAFKGGCT